MTQVSDFKAFLWRHPDIHGLTRTELLMEDIRTKMESIGKQFINDGQPHGRMVSPQTMDCLRLTLQAALQKMVSERTIQNFDVHDAVDPIHPHNALEIWIQPARTAERVVVDLVINP